MGSVLEGSVADTTPPKDSRTVKCGELNLRVAVAAAPRERLRIFVPAGDVVIALGEVKNVSTRNVLPVEIVRLEPLEGSVLLHLRGPAAGLCLPESPIAQYANCAWPNEVQLLSPWSRQWRPRAGASSAGRARGRRLAAAAARALI